MGDFSIQISADLVNRLVDDGVKLKKKPKKTKTKVPQEPPKPQTKGRDKQPPNDSKAHKGTASTAWPAQPPLILPPLVHPSTTELDAIRSVIRESEKVLEKLQHQEDRMMQQVTERAKYHYEKEFKLPDPKPMPCLADYDACRSCYKEHSDDILKCAPLTKSYYDCVQRAKRQVHSTPK